MKGKSGSVRVNSLTPSGLSAMETHENRLDQSSVRRVKRDTPPLIYSPYGEGLSLQESFDAHNEGAKRNKAAGKIALHAFVQFPTEVPLTPENERRMLNEAVAFINASHGGRAVFRARLDRDEVGRHGVDVFYAPKYEKVTRRGKVVEDWISLSKFGKEMALARFGERQKKAKNPESGKFEPVVDTDGQPVLERCDSPYFQGQALQDLWTAHLREKMGLEWVERGKKKVGRDPDRLEPEEYKLAEDQKKVALALERVDMEREFLAAFKAGEFTLKPAKKPESLNGAFREKPALTPERKERLQLCSKAVCPEVRMTLNEVLADKLAQEEKRAELTQREERLKAQEAIIEAAKAEAKAEVMAGLKDDFDTLKSAWATNEATYNVDTEGYWQWWYQAERGTPRHARVNACVESVGGLVGWMARRFEEVMNEVVRYLTPAAQTEFKNEWIDALDRGDAPEWSAPGDGPSGINGGSGQNSPSLGM